MEDLNSGPGPSNGRDLTRRQFVQGVGATAMAASIPLAVPRARLGRAAAPGISPRVETPVARLFRALNGHQRAQLCLPFDHPLRTKVENNWAVAAPKIGDLTADQQALCREIFKGLCSDEGHERFLRQMDEDFGGFANYHVAMFGEPGTAQPFEWVLTGRHVTLRADGNRHEGVSFHGPLFYGHDAESGSPKGPGQTSNVWSYQAERANALLRSLDEEQRALAFLAGRRGAGPHEDAGLAVARLDARQKQVVRHLLGDLIRSFRNFDAEAVQECLREADGVDGLRLTFSRDDPPGIDPTCNIWRLEGPAFAWYFHGTPHVHSWVTITRRIPEV